MLDKTFIEERKKDLLKQKKDLEKELSKLATKENGDYRTKFPNYGNEEEENELEVEMYDEDVDTEKRLENMLKETNKALRKVKEEKYGYCENCGEEIDPARLKAYPSATTCLKCERK